MDLVHSSCVQTKETKQSQPVFKCAFPTKLPVVKPIDIATNVIAITISCATRKYVAWLYKHKNIAVITEQSITGNKHGCV